MGFLSFLGIGSAIAYGLSSGTKRVNRRTMQEAYLKRVNYDVDVERDFKEICKVNGVNPIATNKGILGMQCNNNPPVWPKDGWKDCIIFLREQPDLTSADEEYFRVLYEEARDISLDKLQDCLDEFYFLEEKYFREKDIPQDITIFEKRHFGNLSLEEHQNIVKDLYFNTFWGEIAINLPKIIDSPRFGQPRREIWKVKDYTNFHLKQYYSTCLDYIGYNDYML